MTALLKAEDIETKLTAIIDADLGKYKTPAGETPAIRIFDKKLPAEWTITGTGLEVIIPKNPKKVSVAKNIATEIYKNRWAVKMVLHKQNFEISRILECLKQRLGRDYLECQYMQIDPSDMSSEQWVLEINQMAVVNTY